MHTSHHTHRQFLADIYSTLNFIWQDIATMPFFFFLNEWWKKFTNATLPYNFDGQTLIHAYKVNKELIMVYRFLYNYSERMKKKLLIELIRLNDT